MLKVAAIVWTWCGRGGGGGGGGGGGYGIAGICGIAAFGFCSVIFCKKVMTAASLAATIDLSWTNRSCSRFIFAISWILQASSLAIRSRSCLSSVSKNFDCNSLFIDHLLHQPSQEILPLPLRRCRHIRMRKRKPTHMVMVIDGHSHRRSGDGDWILEVHLGSWIIWESKLVLKGKWSIGGNDIKGWKNNFP